MSSSPPGLVYGLENDFQAGSEAPGQGRHSIRVHLEPLPAASIYRIEIDLILYRYARHAWQVSERALLSTFFRRSVHIAEGFTSESHNRAGFLREWTSTELRRSG